MAQKPRTAFLDWTRMDAENADQFYLDAASILMALALIFIIRARPRPNPLAWPTKCEQLEDEKSGKWELIRGKLYRLKNERPARTVAEFGYSYWNGRGGFIFGRAELNAATR